MFESILGKETNTKDIDQLASDEQLIPTRDSETPKEDILVTNPVNKLVQGMGEAISEKLKNYVPYDVLEKEVESVKNNFEEEIKKIENNLSDVIKIDEKICDSLIESFKQMLNK